jgi:hypothetical protein
MSTRRSRTRSSRSTSTTTARSSGSTSRKQDPNVIPVMCCDTVNRGVAYADGKIFLHQADTTVVALDAKTGEEALVGGQRRSEQGRNQHRDRWSGQGQGLSSVSPAVSSACAAIVTAYNIADGSVAWRGLLDGSGQRHADGPGQDHPSRSAGGQGLRHQHLGRRSVEDRRRHHLGLVLL